MASKSQTAGAAALSAILGAGGATQVAQQEIDAANARLDATQAVIEQVDVHHPTIKSYVRYASEQAITDVLESKLRPIRANQLKQLSDDIRADIVDGEAVALKDLAQRMAEKIRIDDPQWLIWYSQNFANYLQSQIATGQAVGNLVPDQLVRMVDVVDTMSAVAEIYIPEMSAEAEQSIKQSEKTLEEYMEYKDALAESAQ